MSSTKTSGWSESPSPAPHVSTAQGYQGHHKIISSSSSSSSDSVSDDVLVFQRDDVYERTMSWWRVGIRRKLVGCVRAESEVIARMQVRRLFFFFLDLILTRTSFYIRIRFARHGWMLTSFTPRLLGRIHFS